MVFLWVLQVVGVHRMVVWLEEQGLLPLSSRTPLGKGLTTCWRLIRLLLFRWHLKVGVIGQKRRLVLRLVQFPVGSVVMSLKVGYQVDHLPRASSLEKNQSHLIFPIAT